MDVVALSTVQPYAPLTITQARDLLRAQLLHVLDRRNGAPASQIIRLEMPVEGIDPLRWLHAQPHGAKIFWGERRIDCEIAAVGVADQLTTDTLRYDIHAAIDELQGRLATAAPGVRYYGGLRFQPRPDAEQVWQRFGSYRFVLPQFELRREGNTTTLAWNVVLNGTPFALDHAFAALDRLAEPASFFDHRLARPVQRTDVPDRAGWQDAIEAALDLFHSGTLDKIVLARKAIFRCDAPLDPIILFARLKAVTPNSFHFCFQPEPGLGFIGATPERLYGRVGRTIKSEAIAGTRPNGPTPEETQRLGEALLHSEKDRREHIFVRESIRRNLAPLCTTLDIAPEPVLLSLTRRHHLLSAVEGQLAGGVTDADILCSLHPTPAVGGEPTERALEYIAELEPFDRGWYAGPLGWISTNAAEFAVAIRSGLIEGKQLALYSGAGIVAGSTPDNEWNEIENKISDFVNVMRDA